MKLHRWTAADRAAYKKGGGASLLIRVKTPTNMSCTVEGSAPATDAGTGSSTSSCHTLSISMAQNATAPPSTPTAQHSLSSPSATVKVQCSPASSSAHLSLPNAAAQDITPSVSSTTIHEAIPSQPSSAKRRRTSHKIEFAARPAARWGHTLSVLRAGWQLLLGGEDNEIARDHLWLLKGKRITEVYSRIWLHGRLHSTSLK